MFFRPGQEGKLKGMSLSLFGEVTGPRMVDFDNPVVLHAGRRYSITPEIEDGKMTGRVFVFEEGVGQVGEGRLVQPEKKMQNDFLPLPSIRFDYS